MMRANLSTLRKWSSALQNPCVKFADKYPYMQFKFDPKVLMPHLVAVTLFYLLPLFYFSPVTQGYSIIQGDISSFKGMAKSYVDHRETYNEEALWTDAMFSGMPAYQVAVGYFSNVLRYIDRFISIHLFWEGPHLLLFLCMVSFYILCITLSINPWLSIAGAIGFGFSSYFPILIEAGHNAKLHAIAYLPGALAGFLMVLRGNFIRGGVLFGCFMSLEKMISCSEAPRKWASLRRTSSQRAVFSAARP